MGPNYSYNAKEFQYSKPSYVSTNPFLVPVLIPGLGVSSLIIPHWYRIFYEVVFKYLFAICLEIFFWNFLKTITKVNQIKIMGGCQIEKKVEQLIYYSDLCNSNSFHEKKILKSLQDENSNVTSWKILPQCDTHFLLYGHAYKKTTKNFEVIFTVYFFLHRVFCILKDLFNV